MPVRGATLNCPVRISRDVCLPEKAAGKEADEEAKVLSAALLCLLIAGAVLGLAVACG